MNDKLARRVETLFQAALDLDTAARPAFLAAECGDDRELKHEVESLLDFANHSGGLLAAAVSSAAQAAAPTPPPRIGPYRLLHRIGQGGMGAVFLAERDDNEYQQKVAIKLIRWEMTDESTVLRFRHERQILARLQHPHIARLLDGGTTPEGMPYLVMEHIEGQPITDYCAAHHLSLEQRLRLFLSVCAAVQHAHRNLVVHRDLKPSNILVSDTGEPKLLDFGIAKLLADEDTELPSRPTAPATRLLTPEYASPEQVRGEPVTTASDVYCLGIVLYEMLCGKRPHQFSNYSPLELEEVVCRTEVEPPSRVLQRQEDKAGLAAAAQLTGDLDTIVLKALHKDPNRRYGSAEQLAEDLCRYRDGLPVRARRDTASYRAGKFLRRNRVLVTAAAVVALSLIVGAVIAWREAQKAQRRFVQVRQLANSFLFEFHDAIANLPGSTPARSLIVRKAQQYLDNLAQDANDPVLLTELAEAYRKLGDVQGNRSGPNLGDPNGAMESYRRAIAIHERLPRASAVAVSPRIALAMSWRGIGDVQQQLGQPAEALRSLERAVAIHPSLAEAPEHRRSYVNTRHHWADALRLANRNSQASALLNELMPLMRAAILAGSASREERRTLASLLTASARIRDRLGDANGALVQYEEALTLRRQLVAEMPHDAKSLRALQTNLSDLAKLHGGEQTSLKVDYHAALAYYREAVGIAEQITRVDPKDARARYNLANCYMGFGDVLEKNGESTRSQEAHRKGQELVEALLLANPRDVEAAYSKYLFLARTAITQRKAGKQSEALQSSQEALAVAMKLGGTAKVYHAAVPFAHSFVAELSLELRRIPEAIQHFEIAHQTYMRLHEEDRKVVISWAEAIKACLDLGNAYESAARQKQLPAEERAKYWQRATTTYKQGIALHTGLAGKLTLPDASVDAPAKLKAGLNRCQVKHDVLARR